MLVKTRVAKPGLDGSSVLYDGHAVAEVRHDAQAVGHEQVLPR